MGLPHNNSNNLGRDFISGSTKNTVSTSISEQVDHAAIDAVVVADDDSKTLIVELVPDPRHCQSVTRTCSVRNKQVS